MMFAKKKLDRAQFSVFYKRAVAALHAGPHRLIWALVKRTERLQRIWLQQRKLVQAEELHHGASRPSSVIPFPFRLRFEGHHPRSSTMHNCRVILTTQNSLHHIIFVKLQGTATPMRFVNVCPRIQDPSGPTSLRSITC